MLGYLLGIGAALVVAYETISVINEVRDILKKDQRYHHYTARILGGNLYVGKCNRLVSSGCKDNESYIYRKHQKCLVYKLSISRGGCESGW